ncbi:MAG: glycoside hydrolase family protein [Cyanobacteria bacterium P01_G01_bin.38]
MDSTPPDPSALRKTSAPKSQSSKEDHGPIFLTSVMFLGVIWLLFQGAPLQLSQLKARFAAANPFSFGSSQWVASPEPLVMQGGDPHLRALMRTISASESNTDRPYHLLYGGQTMSELTRHPDACVKIVAGPNVGDCTTAAGRYQFLTTTWQAKAQQYHPDQLAWYEFWSDYSFDAEAQDLVVHRWLADTNAWGVDIAQLLYDGQIETVLEMLSGTWTSLGYGIETNSMSAHLPTIYDEMLAEELANVVPPQ